MAAYFVLHLWNAPMNVPWTRGAPDAWSVLLYMKTTLEQAWPVHNPLLGAPFGQDLQDYPLGDPAQILITKLLGLFTGSVAVATNLFFLLTFPLTALSATWALRRLDVRVWTAVVCAVLFAVAPYHFFRGEDHLMIAAYYAVPFSCYLIVSQLAGDVLSVRAAVVLAAIVGLAFTYYAVFTLLLLALAVIASFATGRRDAARRGALALAVIAAVLVVVHSPSWIYNLEHGANKAVAVLHRPSESERFGLKIPAMVLPVDGHRIGALASLRRNYEEKSPGQLQEGPPQALGFVMTVGFAALLWVGLTSVVRRRRSHDRYLEASATATLAALVVGLVGGGALLVAYTASPLVRSWGRLSIFIAFFALVALGRMLDGVGTRLRTRGMRPALVGALLCVFAIVAVIEQTSSAMVPDYSANEVRWQLDAAFVKQATSALPRDSFVVQLPYVPYPEAVYGQARPYLHTDDLRWTFGAMSGRPADWTAGLTGLSPPAMVASAAAAGASGILLDRDGYRDHGRAIDGALRPLLGPPLVIDLGGEMELFGLRAYRDSLQRRLGAQAFARLRYLTLHPVQVLPGGRLSGPQPQPGAFGTLLRDAFAPRVTFDLVNPLSTPRQVTVGLKLASLAARRFSLTLADGSHARFKANPVATGSGTTTLKPGHNELVISAAARTAPFEKVYFTIEHLTAKDDTIAKLLSRAG